MPKLQPSARTGHHTVVLTWNASASSPDPNDNPVGYCLYRTTAPPIAKRIENCTDCEPINDMPIRGTACVDDLVQDGAGYYYMAAAISVSKRTSVFSNTTPAVIPGKVNKGSAPSSSYPLCRAPAASTQAPAPSAPAHH